MNGLTESLKVIGNTLDNLKSFRLSDFVASKTVFVIMDMVNGFTSIGALKSERVNDLIPLLVSLSEKCDDLGIQKLAFADWHHMDSPEFDSYPEHCLEESNESEIVEPIKSVGGYKLIHKNSTNGFHEPEFKEWLVEHPEIENFIVTGNCTDICVQQFALSLKTWFNMNNKRVRVTVPMNAVDTYDLKPHDARLANIMALYNMQLNGIEIIEKILV